VFKQKFEILLPYNIDILIDKISSYYGNNQNYYLSKDKGFFIIDRKIKSIAAPASRIGNRIEFKIESVEASKSKIFGFIEPSSESKGFIFSIIISIIIIIFAIINDVNKINIESERIYFYLKILILLFLSLYSIIYFPKRSLKNIKNELNEIIKTKKLNINKYTVTNYCPKCNSIEDDYKTGICSKCGNKLTKIV
jgi:hypothetical protein